ncbi:hypothetical protein Ndes2526A_g05764 [Nannochloris sp. 'desiccata']
MDAPRGLAVVNLGSHPKVAMKNMPRIQPHIPFIPFRTLGFNLYSAAKCAKPPLQAFLIPVAAGRRDNTSADTPSSFLDYFKSGPALSVLFSTLISTLAYAPASLAMDAVVYNPQDGAETLKTVAGIAYIGLVIFYFIRLFQKRADKFTSERVGSSSVDGKDAAAVEDDEEKDALDLEAAAAAALAEDNVTPLQCLIGVAQAGTICYLLFLLSTSVDGYFQQQDLPSQYTARNITVLIQTVSRGLVYLATFIFGANAVGLASLGIALIVAPDWVNNGPQSQKKQEQKLPKVNITDDIFTLRRAFKEAEEMGRRNAEKENK